VLEAKAGHADPRRPDGVDVDIKVDVDVAGYRLEKGGSRMTNGG
jgi:hypothetical protein